MLVPSEENVAQHEVLCAMVNNCSVLYLEQGGGDSENQNSLQR